MSEHVIKAGDGLLKLSTLPMIDLGAYIFFINKGKITPEKYFMNVYVEEVFELDHVCTRTK